jgi:hypothetical protein
MATLRRPSGRESGKGDGGDRGHQEDHHDQCGDHDPARVPRRRAVVNLAIGGHASFAARASAIGAMLVGLLLVVGVVGVGPRWVLRPANRS